MRKKMRTREEKEFDKITKNTMALNHYLRDILDEPSFSEHKADFLEHIKVHKHFINVMNFADVEFDKALTSFCNYVLEEILYQAEILDYFELRYISKISAYFEISYYWDKLKKLRPKDHYAVSVRDTVKYLLLKNNKLPFFKKLFWGIELKFKKLYVS